MNILITGAAGFIGSHASEYFVSQGHNIIGLDNFDDFYPLKFKVLNIEGLNKKNNFQFYQGSILDRRLLANIFDSHKIEVVIHLAAKAGVRPSIKFTEEYYEVNVNGTLSLLETMQKFKIKKMLFASSSSVYGNNVKIPFSENDSVDNPISPYASTKKSGELLCHVYHHLHNFDITCLRFFTVFGPRQRPDLAIHKFTKLIDEEKSIPFYGNGSSSRDYTYIEDIINGINCALINLKGYHIYNLGESGVITLRQLVDTLQNAVGKKAILNKLPKQQGDVERTYADISKAKLEIGYDPKFSFNEGIKRFVEWYNIHKSLLYR